MEPAKCKNCLRHKVTGTRVINVTNYHPQTGKNIGTHKETFADHHCTFRNISLHNLKPKICNSFQPK